MSLAYPLLLVLGLLLAAALTVGAVLAARRRSAALAAAGVSVAGRRNRPLGLWFSLAGVVLLAVAVAGPAASLPVGRSAGTVILAMDVSNSMSADDVAPSRLAAAQQAASGVHRRPARHRRHRRGRVRPGCADHVTAQRGSRRGEGGGAEPADLRWDIARLGHPRFAERDHRQVGHDRRGRRAA